MLANTLTFEGSAFASIYKAVGNTDVCAIPESQNRLLAVSLFDAAPTDFLGDGTGSTNTGPDHSDRFTDLNVQGIANEPQVVFTANSENVQLFVGKENVVDLDMKINTVLWYGK